MYSGVGEASALGRGGAFQDRESAQIAPAPSGRIRAELDVLQKLTEAVAQGISAVEERISPVLRPQGPSTGQGGSEKEPREPSGLAGALASINSRLQAMSGQLQNIHARIDL